jgi:hypothetical protein
MLYRDTDVSRRLAAERHAELERDGRMPDAAASPAAESRSRGRFRFAWLRVSFRSTGPLASS